MLKKYQDTSARTIIEEGFAAYRGTLSFCDIKNDTDHAVKYGLDTVLASFISAGYELYGIHDREAIGESRKFQFQRRVDRSYPSLPLCLCNDKVFVNATVYVNDYRNRDANVSKSIELNMTHEVADDQWIKLDPYGMPLTWFADANGVLEQEKKLVTLWAYAHAIYNDKL